MAKFGDEVGPRDAPGTSGRRDFMRKAAVIGTGAFVLPTIITVDPADAQALTSPPPEPPGRPESPRVDVGESPGLRLRPPPASRAPGLRAAADRAHRAAPHRARTSIAFSWPGWPPPRGRANNSGRATNSSSRSRPPGSIPTAIPAASATDCSSRSGASSASQTTSPRRVTLPVTSSAKRVFPLPRGPVSVTSRCFSTSSTSCRTSAARATNRVRVAGRAVVSRDSATVSLGSSATTSSHTSSGRSMPRNAHRP